MSLEHLRYTSPEEAGQWTLEQLQADQAEYDASPYWDIKDPEIKLVHLLCHGDTTIAKLARALEQSHHTGKFDWSVIISEVIPDLVMHANQLANMAGVDLAETVVVRRNANMTRIEDEWAKKGINPLDQKS